MVRPSGVAFLTPSVAVAPPPPGRFSTTMRGPPICSTLLAMVRAAMSELPPAATETTSVICGACAGALPGRANSAMAAVAVQKRKARRCGMT
jgi:hypothetical protein